MAAGHCAAQNGLRVIIVDDNPALGGQIWRGEQERSSTTESGDWFKKLRSANVEFVYGARVINQPEAGRLVAEAFDAVYEFEYKKLILATGARERFLPFPGWTLPNVCGAGGLQALVKSGLPINGKKVVVAGSGPLLLAVATYLKKEGAEILLIAEQASRSSLIRFGIGLINQPQKIFQAINLKSKLAGIGYLTDCWPVMAEGQGRLESVKLQRGQKIRDVKCDYLACGFGLIPNVELAVLLGCELESGNIRVDDYQQTTIPDIYCAGEPTGIGGLELSLTEGRIAGYAAAGNTEEASKLFNARRKLQRFAQLLDTTFKLRDELKELTEPNTIVCRCEDVTLERINIYSCWREAKLQSRVGMGPCQGRICGPAVEFLLDWNLESVRPPVFPARVESLECGSDKVKG